MIPGQAQQFFEAAAAQAGASAYEIERSLRFNSDDSAYLNKTFASGGNSNIFTISLWTKRSKLSTDQNILNASSNPGGSSSTAPRTEFRFNPTNDQIKFAFNSLGSAWKTLETDAVFKDVSAWYHIVVSVDTTQTTSTDRVKIYVNGEQQTLTGTYPDLNEWLPYGKKYGHSIGNYTNNYNAYFDGYLAEVNFIDGQALAATDFGAYDDNNNWNPKDYTGSYYTSVSNAEGALPIHNTTDAFGETKGSGNRTDSFASSLVLAISGNGSFQDISADIRGSGANKTVTANGNVTTSATEGKYYSGGSLELPGAAGDYFSIPNSADFAFGTGDFTVEFWIKTTDTAFNILDVAATGGWANVVVNANAPLFWQTVRGSTNLFSIPTYDNLIDGSWHHIAFVRSSGVFTPYLDGIAIGTSGGYTDNTNYSEVTGNLNIGTGPNGVLNGYLQDIRIYKGAAKYTSNFTIGSRTNSFELNFSDNTSSSTLGTDTSGLDNDFTVNNIEAVAAFGIENACSILQYSQTISFPITYDTTVTYEFFIRVTTAATYMYAAHDTTSADKWNIGINSSGNLLFGNFNGGWTTFSSAVLIDGDWHFVRLTTNGTSTSLYIDGSLNATNTSGGSVTTGTQFTNKIESAGAGAFRIAYLRITNGGTPPTTGIPALADMNQPAGTGGTLAFFDKLDDIASSGTKTSDGGGVTITMSAATVATNTSGTDSLIDSPTNYEAASGNNGGNYATINPLQTKDYSSGSPVIANGNLEIDTTGTGWSSATGTIAVSSGKSYWEYTCSNLSGSELIRNGIFKQGGVLSGTGGDDVTSPDVYIYASNAQKWTGSAFTSYGATYTADDVIGVALDLDAGTLTFYKNGVSQGSAYTGLSGTFSPYFAQSSDPKSLVNFGQRPFAYTPPTDHLALVTTNLSDPTIAEGSTAFDAKLWSGNGSTQSISGVNFSPDFVWIKRRSSNYSSLLYDTVRGNGPDKGLISDSTTAEGSASDNSTYGYLNSFDSDGFSLVAGSTPGYVNASSQTYVGWAWDAGSSTVTNNDGTHSAQVRANPSTGFSISTHSRTTAASISTWGHGLGAAPEFAILKPYNGAYNWFAWHKDAGNNRRFYLNSSSAGNTYGFDVWSSDSTTLGIYGTIIAGGGTALDCKTYAWAPIAGYSSFGGYTGNGSTDGPFVYTGFRPAFLMFKRTDTTGNWEMYDTARDPYNPYGLVLLANTNGAETDVRSSYPADILSNGFKLRHAGAAVNASGGTYIYTAFAEHPFKTARAR